MRAITIWQPWASLIAYEAKPFEFRTWPPSSACTNQRIAIHAGARRAKASEIDDLISRLRDENGAGTGLKVDVALPLLERVQSSPDSLPLSAVVCTAHLSPARKASSLFKGSVADSDRIDQHIWAWPLDAIQRLEPPVPARGHQRFWHWHGAPAEGAAA